jgi:hypothetical protein
MAELLAGQYLLYTDFALTWQPAVLFALLCAALWVLGRSKF